MDYLNRELAISLVRATTTPSEIRSIVRNNNAKSVQMSENMRLIIENIYQTKRVEVRIEQTGREPRRTTLRVLSDLGVDVHAHEPRRQF